MSTSVIQLAGAAPCESAPRVPRAVSNERSGWSIPFAARPSDFLARTDGLKLSSSTTFKALRAHGVVVVSNAFSFLGRAKQNLEKARIDLYDAIAPLDRGAKATPEDIERVDQRPSFLRPSGPIYQAINTDTLRAQNMESWPFFNQVTANLVPIDSKKVDVRFDVFKIAGVLSFKAPERARGELEMTYLDDQLRISRGYRGNLFVLVMEDPAYRVPV